MVHLVSQELLLSCLVTKLSCQHEQCSHTSKYDPISTCRDCMASEDSFSCYFDQGRGDDEDSSIDETYDRLKSLLQVFSSESDSDDDHYKNNVLLSRTRLLRHKGIAVIIPEHNKNGFQTDEFTLKVIEDTSRFPETDPHSIEVSHVIALEPHGAVFYEDKPALVHIPLYVKLGKEHKVVCLCNDSGEFDSPSWELLPTQNYTVHDNCVIISTSHFCLFKVLIKKPYPGANKEIRANEGGFVRVEQIPGVEVNFPPGALYHNIDARVKVLFEDPPFQKDPACDPPRALATPVVMLEPHGCQFNCQAVDPVTVRLPIPQYHEICQRFGNDRVFTIWHSATTEHEPLVAKQLETSYTIESDDSGNYSICFPVTNFCFIWALVDIVSSKLNEARLGVLHFFSDTEFQMKCQALMVENQDTCTFGLEVLCYHSDKKLPDIGNYQHWVGGAMAKPVKQGSIAVRLVSECFEADTSAGEDPSLEQLEKDFKGLEFEKQFACKFKNRPVDKGVFGKVFVERILPDGHREDIFKFNLIKSGSKQDVITMEGNPWMLEPVKELAGVLNITNDKNWKIFARKLGFTQHEISNKFSSIDPFSSILSLFMGRGGTADEFVKAMYDVNQAIPEETSATSSDQAGNSLGLTRTPVSRKRACSSFEDQHTNKQSCITPDLSISTEDSGPMQSPSGTKISESWTPGSSETIEFFGGNDPYSVVNPCTITSSPPGPPQKKSVSIPSGSASPLSKLSFGQICSTPLMESTGPSGRNGAALQLSQPPVSRSTTARRDLSRNIEELSEKKLWEIAGHVMHNWRTLGHMLDLEETDLCSIEHSHRGNVREQAFQMLHMWKLQSPEECTKGRLYRSLSEVGLNDIALKCGGKRRPLGERSINCE